MSQSTLRVFKALVIANWRELIRDIKVVLLLLVPPALVMGVFFIIVQAFTSTRATAAVAVPPNAAPEVRQVIAEAKSLSRIEMEEIGPAEIAEIQKGSRTYDAIIVMPAQLENGAIAVTVLGAGSAEPYAIKVTFEKAVRRVSNATVTVQVSGGQLVDPLRYGTTSVLLYTLASLAIFGIATPIASMRERGVLRLLGTTPVSRLVLFAAQLPSRLGLAVLITAIGLAGAGFKWQIPLGNLCAAFLIAMLGFWMLGALGYLIGGVTGSSEGTVLFGNLLLQVIMYVGNVVMPPGAFGKWQQTASWFNPLSYLADALRHVLGGQSTPLTSLWIDLAAVVGIALLLTSLAMYFFRWDQGEQKYRARTDAVTARGA